MVLRTLVQLRSNEVTSKGSEAYTHPHTHSYMCVQQYFTPFGSVSEQGEREGVKSEREVFELPAAQQSQTTELRQAVLSRTH